MSLPITHSNTSKRRRVVEGSCWPCKQRRIKCDLQKPTCRKCIASNTVDCSYEKVLLRWKQASVRRNPAVQPCLSDGLSLAVGERRAIGYFKDRLWPLFSTVNEPCPPPVALALRSQPVLHALCVFADEHRALQEMGYSKSAFEERRLQCLTIVRGQLGCTADGSASLNALLVAVLLLYFHEGYINCTQPEASTDCHLTGALAIVDALGGFHVTWSSSDKMTRMLLSEMASTDLTDAILQDRPPSFLVTVWDGMDSGSVWWESLPGAKSLATVLSTMAEMCYSRHKLLDGKQVSSDKTQIFESALQPVYSMLESPSEDQTRMGSSSDVVNALTIASLSLNRAFQHAGLIYLYRAIYQIPMEHFLVQQHVHACLACIQGMDSASRTRNCTLFPLYIAGAHTTSEIQRNWILEVLNIIHANLQFASVLSIRSALQQIWSSTQGGANWSDCFKGKARYTLVI